MEVIVAPKARSDIATILAWTLATFGPQTAQRYGNLLETAIRQVAAAPGLAGSVERPEIAAGCRTYHLFHARKRAGGRGSRIRNPRHFLLYRVTDAGVVEIARVLHDSMELEQYLPEELRGRPE